MQIPNNEDIHRYIHQNIQNHDCNNVLADAADYSFQLRT